VLKAQAGGLRPEAGGGRRAAGGAQQQTANSKQQSRPNTGLQESGGTAAAQDGGSTAKRGVGSKALQRPQQSRLGQARFSPGSWSAGGRCAYLRAEARAVRARSEIRQAQRVDGARPAAALPAASRRLRSAGADRAARVGPRADGASACLERARATDGLPHALDRGDDRRHVRDDALHLVQSAWIARQLPVNAEIVVSGRVSERQGRPCFDNPEWERWSDDLVHQRGGSCRSTR